MPARGSILPASHNINLSMVYAPCQPCEVPSRTMARMSPTKGFLLSRPKIRLSCSLFSPGLTSIFFNGGGIHSLHYASTCINFARKYKNQGQSHILQCWTKKLEGQDLATQRHTMQCFYCWVFSLIKLFMTHILLCFKVVGLHGN